jgi:arylsulfatase A-like enzyme
MWFSPYNLHAANMGAGPGNDKPTAVQEDANLYPNGLPSYYLAPSFNEADVSDKPAWVQELRLKWAKKAVSDEEVYKEEQLSIVRNLASFDRSVNALLNFLDVKGELSNTLIIYINDNGLHLGEHRILKKYTL